MCHNGPQHFGTQHKATLSTTLCWVSQLCWALFLLNVIRLSIVVLIVFRPFYGRFFKAWHNDKKVSKSLKFFYDFFSEKFEWFDHFIIWWPFSVSMEHPSNFVRVSPLFVNVAFYQHAPLPTCFSHLLFLFNCCWRIW